MRVERIEGVGDCVEGAREGEGGVRKIEIGSDP